MKIKKNNNKIYIVICTCRDADEPYYIDSVWTSEKKAEARKDKLNGPSLDEWREDLGYLNFEVLAELVCS